MIFRYRKFIGLTLSISIFLLNFQLTCAQAGMIATEHIIHQESELFSDRLRVKAFLARADVMSKLRVSGIRHEEALSWLDSLTDREIASIADKIDQIPAAAGGSYEFDGSLFSIIGLAIITIFAVIAIYISRTIDNTEKAQQKESRFINQLPNHPLTETGVRILVEQ